MPRPMSRNGKPKIGNTVKDLVNALLEDLCIEFVAWNAVFIQKRAKPAKGVAKMAGGRALTGVPVGSAVPVQERLSPDWSSDWARSWASLGSMGCLLIQ